MHQLGKFLRRKTIAIALALLLCPLSLTAQSRLEGYNETKIAKNLLDGRWTAWWISTPQGDRGDYGVWCFRKTFELGAKPSEFIIHVSATTSSSSM